MRGRVWEHDTVPALYELTWIRAGVLGIRVHDKVFEALTSLPWKTAPVAQDHDKLGLRGFVPPSSTRAWGFNEAIRPSVYQGEGWLTWECELPRLYTKEGSSGNPVVRYSLRTSLAILFVGLGSSEVADVDTGWPEKQLLTIDGMRVEEDLYGGTIVATVTPALVKWLAVQPDEHQLEPVAEAMMLSHRAMYWESDEECRNDLRFFRYKAWCRQPKWINLDIPGNACGLDPDSYSEKSLDRGYRLVPHNTDSGVQQLTLLAGLCKLHDLARRK